ncbi:MAG: tetratricopeptide repeat protein [Verrucomicrobiota bacterium]
MEVDAVCLAKGLAGGWHAGFMWDDDRYVTENPLLTAPDGLRRIWLSLDAPSQYFPLTYTTFRLEHALWGFDPAGYHWVNILLHAANALLAWRLLARLRAPGAWLGAALFALHPVQVESVAWITERKNVLMGFFFLLSLLAWCGFLDEKTRRPWRFYTLALVFYGLALSAKTTACTLPGALLLVLWLEKKPIDWRRLGQVAPFVALGLGMGLVTVWWERYHQGTRGQLFEIGPVERVLIASRAVWFYIGKLIWPANLIFSYPRWSISASDPLAYVWLLATAAAGAAIWRARRWAGRSVEVAAVFFVVTLSPVLGFIMLYTFAYSFVADHYQYLACLGPLALAAAGMERGWGWMKIQSAVPRVLYCAALLTALGALTWRQCGMYGNEETLWRATLARNPGSWLAHNNLGELYLRQGGVEKSVAQFRDALEIRPENADTHFNLGIALGLEGKDEEAIGQYRKALAGKPGDTEVRYNLANALVKHGKVDEAIAQYRRALELKPDYTEARNNLGVALFTKGELEEAIAQYRRALEIKPDYAEARNNLGAALVKEGRLEEAIAQYRLALEKEPGYAEVENNLGKALLLKGDLDGAMACFEKTTPMSGDPLARWYGLGNGFLQRKDWEEAIACYRKTIQINPSSADAYDNLGVALCQKGEIKEAMEAWQRGLEIKPQQLKTLNNMAWLLATTPEASLRNGARAVALAARADQLSGGGDPTILRTLAAAYAEAQSYGVATVTARRALQLAREQKNDALAATLQEEIKLYEADKPARDSTLQGSAPAAQDATR